MLRTIQIGSCVSVQGVYEGPVGEDRIRVRVGERVFEGVPISKKTA